MARPAGGSLLPCQRTPRVGQVGYDHEPILITEIYALVCRMYTHAVQHYVTSATRVNAQCTYCKCRLCVYKYVWHDTAWLMRPWPLLLRACRPADARSVVQEALGMTALRAPRAPFKQHFLQLLARIEAAGDPSTGQLVGKGAGKGASGQMQQGAKVCGGEGSAEGCGRENRSSSTQAANGRPSAVENSDAT